MDVAMSGDPQRQQQTFSQGFDKNPGRRPHDGQQQEPYRRHHIERPTDFLKVMREAGILSHHKLCLYCGKVASQGHRKSWRLCRNPCVFDPAHTHIGKLCPYLLQEANSGWCFKRALEDMNKDLEAARRTKKLTEKSTSDLMQAPPPPHQLSNAVPIPFGNSIGGVQQPGCSAGSSYGNYGTGFGMPPSSVGYTAGYGMPLPAAGYSSCTAPGFNPGYGAVLAHPNDPREYMVPGHSGRVDNSSSTGPPRPRDVRERSPTTQASSVNYRDRTPRAHNGPSTSSERGRSSFHPSPRESSFTSQPASIKIQPVFYQDRSESAPQVQPQEDIETARVRAAPRTPLDQSEQQHQTQAAELAELREQLANSQVRYRTVATAFVRHMLATQHLLENMQSLLVMPPSLDANTIAIPPAASQAEGSSEAHLDAGPSLKKKHE
ncbi:hypothetical protein PTMSG1_00687 [Pyrenophora teres f. maculata]|nr:hypothetical protein PTMSG1_00687 [Pyrenophora teres f. maculata]